ncbi:MAG: hypothetical protein HY661_10290 [Betaproteobacteria bacterium]|nr:hypothetical protein [Betaproteobacteria bacterium]
MILRQLLASLIAATLIVGAPAIASAGSSGADCATVSIASVDDGCCGGADALNCSIACLASSAMVVGKVAGGLVPALVASPPEHAAASGPSLVRAPDTAPPKSSSA